MHFLLTKQKLYLRNIFIFGLSSLSAYSYVKMKWCQLSLLFGESITQKYDGETLVRRVDNCRISSCRRSRRMLACSCFVFDVRWYLFSTFVQGSWAPFSNLIFANNEQLNEPTNDEFIKVHRGSQTPKVVSHQSIIIIDYLFAIWFFLKP